MPQAEALADSLQRFAELLPDPAPAIYAAMFARFPESEALFVMDRGGQVRGQMLAIAFEALLEDAAGERLAGLVAIERMNHVNIGVPDAVFDAFFPLLRDVVREALGAGWTPAMDDAWRERLARF